MDRFEEDLQGLRFTPPPRWLKARAMVAGETACGELRRRKRRMSIIVTAGAAAVVLVVTAHHIFTATGFLRGGAPAGTTNALHGAPPAFPVDILVPADRVGDFERWERTESEAASRHVRDATPDADSGGETVIIYRATPDEDEDASPDRLLPFALPDDASPRDAEASGAAGRP